jgi:Arc/MetJ-type ribon-helix-helix transcriptional regulator
VNLKQRLSASVDADLIAAVEEAVATGRASTVSAWVNDALRLKQAHDRRLDALAAFVAAYEGRHGRIGAEEMDAAARRARGRATPVRSGRGGPARPARRRRAG